MKAPRLREWREARGYTQASLAERAGLCMHTVLRIEQGRDLRPSTARKLADALGVEIFELLHRPPARPQRALDMRQIIERLEASHQDLENQAHGRSNGLWRD